MAPGYYNAVVAACRDAGFEPRLDEQAAGSTVWGNIARGRGVGLVVGSLRYQLPRGLALIALAAPAPALAIDLVWPTDRTTPAIPRTPVPWSWRPRTAWSCSTPRWVPP